MTETKPKCLVIGAGPSGLVTLRHLKEVADIKCFEAKDQIGGMWLYTDITELNHPNLENDVYYKHSGYLHSSMYKELVSNSPYQLMDLKDFPHKDPPNFLLREHFIDYILSYTKHFDLFKHIRFSTFVLSVRLSAGLTDSEKKEWGVEGKRKFSVKYCSSSDEHHVGYEEFDYVIVCNGHYSYPRIPKIEGDEEFEGDKVPLHCFRDFNVPNFKGKDILVIGAMFSAIDFMIQLLFNPYISQDFVGTIYLTGETEPLEKSTDFKELYDKGKVVLKRGKVQKLGTNEVTFADGSKAKVDMMCYGCGYHWRFPFLENPDKLIDWSLDVHDGRYWGPIFTRMFSIREPNLIFVGNHDGTAFPLPLMERQIIVAKKFIAGELVLPTQEEMYKSLEKDIEEFSKHGIPMRHYFRFIATVSDVHYMDQLRDLAKMDFDKVYHDTLKHFSRVFVEFADVGNWLAYRAFDFKAVTPDGFKNTSEHF